MPKKDYRELPDHYPVCLHGDCPLAATCLHHDAWEQLCKTEELMRLINRHDAPPPRAVLTIATVSS